MVVDLKFIRTSAMANLSHLRSSLQGQGLADSRVNGEVSWVGNISSDVISWYIMCIYIYT